MAREADIRKDIPKYRIYKDGVYTEEVLDITEYWKDDMVGFLIGCSFTFETPLLENGIPIQHIEDNCNVPMYRTNIACERSEEHTSELQSRGHLVCRLLLEKKKRNKI